MEIRKAAGFLKLEDIRRTPDRQDLASSAQTLTQLAALVERGAARTLDLNGPFAMAEYTLAESHCFNAMVSSAEQ